MAVINGVGYLDVCKTAVAHLLTYLVINSVMEKQESFALFFRTTLLYLLFWTIPNLLSVIIFEDGIYYDEIYSNGIYILGGKNSFTPFLIITVWLCFIYGTLYRSGHSILLTWSAIVIAFLSGLFGGSGTLTIVSLIFVVIALFGNGFTLSPRVIFIALILIEILVVVVRVQTLFGWFFELFGKDASFTGRIELWDSGLHMIGKRSIFGYGNPGFGIIWDPTHLEWYSAHNALLDKCLRFGIPGMLIYLAIYMQPFLTLQGEREWNNAILYGLSMAFLTGLTETYLWSNAYLFAYIFICLGYPRFFREKAVPVTAGIPGCAPHRWLTKLFYQKVGKSLLLVFYVNGDYTLFKFI